MVEGTILSYKPKVFVDTSNLTEEQWLEYRRHGIGGSDAAAVFGVSPFATARDLYYDKLKIATHEDPEDNWVQKRMGHLLEDLVAEIFHVRTGYQVYQIKRCFSTQSILLCWRILTTSLPCQTEKRRSLKSRLIFRLLQVRPAQEKRLCFAQLLRYTE